LTLKMLTNISPCWRKCSRDTCMASSKECDPPKLHCRELPHPASAPIHHLSYPRHRTFSSGHMIRTTPFTLTKEADFRTFPAGATATRWSCTMSTVTPYGSRQPRTSAKVR
jgi:hypothetical protein